MTLQEAYGARRIWGIPFGYKGFLAQGTPAGAQACAAAYTHTPWTELNRTNVKLIHKRGGTILGSSRGRMRVAR